VSEPVLQIHDLSVRYRADNTQDAVRKVSLSLMRGESVGLIGESGSGKSSLALAVMGLLGSGAQVEGSVVFNGVELTKLRDTKMERYRWKRIAIVFQNSLDVLNPVLTIGEQIAECMVKHLGGSKAAIRAKAAAYLAMTGLAAKWARAYPHQLSGGMRQKALIAMALSCEPDVILVDEPTMALDSVSKQEVIRLLLRLKAERNFAMLVISHELPVIAAMTSRVLVMYLGNILEEGPTEVLLKNPFHPYTRGLLYASPAVNPYRDMWGIPGEIETAAEGMCPFYSRCSQRIDACAQLHPTLKTLPGRRKICCLRGGIVTLLTGYGLTKTYVAKGNTVQACRDCNIEVKAGEVCALIGESGSGKTTLAEMLAGILPPDEGSVVFDGKPVHGNSTTSQPESIQIVFQDPLSSTNERLTIADIVREPLDILHEGTKTERTERVKKALASVQLATDEAFLHRRGFMLSGGQRQRVAVARALVMRPRLLIADEISAMLDPSTAANLMRLLKGLQNAEGFAMLYITHDLALAQKISDKVYVMHEGAIIEHGPVEDVLENPKAEYTRMLIHGSNVGGCPEETASD